MRWFNFFAWARNWRQGQGLGRVRTRPARPIVVSRPATLEQRYQLVEYAPLIDEVFTRLKQRVYQELDLYARQPQSRAIFRESGQLTSGRPYFYLKPSGEVGWLFERDGSGWTISAAVKDAVRSTFVREREVFDSVTLYLAKDRAVMPRVKAPGLGSGNDLLSMIVYEQKLLQRLGLS